MLLELKEKVWKANLDLVKYDLVTHTFGNVSGMDRDQGLIVIKPSGMVYDELMPEDMVVVDMEGNMVARMRLREFHGLHRHQIYRVQRW